MYLFKGGFNMTYYETVDERIAGMKSYLRLLNNLSKKDPQKAKEISKKSLIGTGIMDENGNILPPYNGQKITDTDFTRGPKVKKR
jgi:hypothetical protein